MARWATDSATNRSGDTFDRPKPSSNGANTSAAYRHRLRRTERAVMHSIDIKGLRAIDDGDTSAAVIGSLVKVAEPSHGGKRWSSRQCGSERVHLNVVMVNLQRRCLGSTGVVCPHRRSYPWSSGYGWNGRGSNSPGSRTIGLGRTARAGA